MFLYIISIYLFHFLWKYLPFVFFQVWTEKLYFSSRNLLYVDIARLHAGRFVSFLSFDKVFFPTFSSYSIFTQVEKVGGRSRRRKVWTSCLHIPLVANFIESKMELDLMQPEPLYDSRRLFVAVDAWLWIPLHFTWLFPFCRWCSFPTHTYHFHLISYCVDEQREIKEFWGKRTDSIFYFNGEQNFSNLFGIKLPHMSDVLEFTWF